MNLNNSNELVYNEVENFLRTVVYWHGYGFIAIPQSVSQILRKYPVQVQDCSKNIQYHAHALAGRVNIEKLLFWSETLSLLRLFL